MSIRTAIRTALAATVLAVAAPMLGLTAAADQEKGGRYSYDNFRSGIIVYDQTGFSGRSVAIDHQTDLRDLRLNDRVSSIEVLSGRWEVCSDSGFRGRCEIIDRDVANLARFGLNNNISSIRPVDRRYTAGDRTYRTRDLSLDGLYGGRGTVRANHNAPVVLYADPAGYGRSVAIYGAEPHLHALRFNDVASSIDVRYGAWLVCSDPYFRGRCRVIDVTVDRLRAIGLNDNITSIRPVEDYADDRRGRRNRG